MRRSVVIQHFPRQAARFASHAFVHLLAILQSEQGLPVAKSNQNDARDAEAICEAASRPNMRFVPVKFGGHVSRPAGASGARARVEKSYPTGQPTAGFPV